MSDQRSVNEQLATMGGILRCLECGIERKLTAEQIATYLMLGWPRHCGYTMRWVTARELAQERSER